METLYRIAVQALVITMFLLAVPLWAQGDTGGAVGDVPTEVHHFTQQGQLSVLHLRAEEWAERHGDSFIWEEIGANRTATNQAPDNLSSFDVVILDGSYGAMPTLPENFETELNRFVRAGGGVVVTSASPQILCGGQGSCIKWFGADARFALYSGPADVRVVEPTAIGATTLEAGDIVRPSGVWNSAATIQNAAASVAAAFSTGEPYVLAASVGDGRAVWMSSLSEHHADHLPHRHQVIVNSLLWVADYEETLVAKLGGTQGDLDLTPIVYEITRLPSDPQSDDGVWFTGVRVESGEGHTEHRYVLPVGLPPECCFD